MVEINVGLAQNQPFPHFEIPFLKEVFLLREPVKDIISFFQPGFSL